ncbi:MAG: amidohydrolase family protein [Chloroflexi bacterium]|nr:amidohydrolase family protein [Chloroflexota bacterium]MBU1746081.1 amidohydrolase family protein [Chloroflexota bacterium]
MDIDLFTTPPPRKRWPDLKWILVGLVAVLIVAVLAGRAIWPAPVPTRTPAPPTPTPARTATPAFRLTGRLVFVAGPRGQEDVYTVNPDGTDRVNLTNHPATYEGPAWSPSGDRIAFVSNYEGHKQAYVMSADGSQITPVPGTGPLDLVAGWSPDGRYLLLTSYRDVNAEVYAVEFDSGKAVNLTRHPAEDETPAWSPGGTYIAWASDRDGTEERRARQIYTMNVDGSRLVRLTDFFYGASYPVWSPDGQWIAFSAVRKVLVNNLLEEDTYVMRADGSESRLLLRQTGWTRPQCWSPDGQRLLVNHIQDVDGEFQYRALILSPFEEGTPAYALPNKIAETGRAHRWQAASASQPVAPIALPQVAPTPVPQLTTLALVNGTLIDGTGAAPVPDAAVVIRDGRIVAAGPRAGVTIPTDARVIDVQGGTILPGFINAHVHEAYNAHNLAAWAQAGVTTVREMNAPAARLDELESIYAFRDAARAYPQYARIVGASPILTVPDGYGTMSVTSPDDARQTTLALVDAGADVIKISLEDVLMGQLPRLSVTQTRAIVAAAHERGVPVTAHVSRVAQLEVAVDAGVDDAAHMVVDQAPDDLIARMVEQGMVWVPTLELWKLAYMGRETADNLRRFVAAGGQVALGTDYAGSAALRFELGMPIRELLFMQEAGMTPMQVIVAATRNAAHVCNRAGDLGTLEPGKIADVLVVDGDPLADLLVLRNVRLVIRDGVVIRE